MHAVIILLKARSKKSKVHFRRFAAVNVFVDHVYCYAGFTEVYQLCDPWGTPLQETCNRGRKPVDGLKFPSYCLKILTP